MEWLARMNAALDYIEEHLADEIDVVTAARLAQTSAYNFQRMFAFVTDTSLSEYIRRRRLTLAALELQQGNGKVIDVAMRYGYESPVSFARAFQAMHGMNPSQARGDGIMLTAYPRLVFQISIKGAKPMNYRIETREPFQAYGIEGIFRNDESGPMPKMPKDLWDQCHKDGNYERLSGSGALKLTTPMDFTCNVHAVCSYRDTPEGTFPYMLAAFRGPDSRTDGYTIATIPAATWAIFPSGKIKWDDFHQTIDNMYSRFFSEWLPTADYEQIGGLDMEVYGGNGDVCEFELWFAVKKK